MGEEVREEEVSEQEMREEVTEEEIVREEVREEEVMEEEVREEVREVNRWRVILHAGAIYIRSVARTYGLWATP